MTQIAAFLEQTAALHHHLCPRQVLGVRIGIYAAELLDLALPQTGKRLVTFVETDGCFADGVAIATGCWFGHRTLRLIDYGKVAATCVDRESGRAVRIVPRSHARQAAIDALPSAKSRWHAQLDAYQTLPTDVLLAAAPVRLTLSLETIMSRPGVRTHCQQCDEEILNGREVVREGRVLCQRCAGDAYYHTV